MQCCEFENFNSASKDEQVQLNICIPSAGILKEIYQGAMLLIFFFVLLSICYLCAKSRLNNMNPAVPSMPILWMFHIMECWGYIVTTVLGHEAVTAMRLTRPCPKGTERALKAMVKVADCMPKPQAHLALGNCPLTSPLLPGDCQDARCHALLQQAAHDSQQEGPPYVKPGFPSKVPEDDLGQDATSDIS